MDEDQDDEEEAEPNEKEEEQEEDEDALYSLVLTNTDKELVSLSGVVGDRITLILMLRHFGWYVTSQTTQTDSSIASFANNLWVEYPPNMMYLKNCEQSISSRS